MARDPPLVNSSPTIAPGKVHIGHVQLRDLIICPREQGVVNYVQSRSIIEHNLRNPSAAPRSIADTSFIANTLTSLPLEDSGSYLLAAGGQDAQIHLSMQQPDKSSTTLADVCLPGSINNSILLTSLNLAHSNQSSVEPRIGISNNDCTFRFYDIALRTRDASSAKIFNAVGALKLDVPINHSSISPDGRTLLSAGDSNKVHLHHLSGSSRVTFAPITSLCLPPCPNIASFSDYSSLTASFSTAFSANGSKFAVASQEGIVVVWDVRSSKPLKTFTTDRDRRPSGGHQNGSSGVQEASGWLSDDPWEWTRGTSRAPGWSVRSLKFAKDHLGGKEIMAFTEHTSMVHVVDAQTFETHEVMRMPSIPRAPSSSSQYHSQSQQNATLGTALARARARHRPYQLRTSLSPPASSQTPLFSLRSNILHNAQPGQRMLQALEDTFRVSPRLHHALSQRGLDNVEEEENYTTHIEDDDGGVFEVDPSEDVLVIPPLGDRSVEADVRALFGRHGIRTRQARVPEEVPMLDEMDSGSQGQSQMFFTASGDNIEESDSEVIHDTGMMEADELESDYCASHTPSRSPSPSPPSNAMPSRLSSVGASRRRERTSEREGPGDVDLAGVCFDPCGGYLYVASVDGVAEWKVNGREKRWWSDFNDGWA